MTARNSERKQIIASLRKVSLFSECTDAELLRIDGLLTELSVRPGRTLTSGGANALQFVIVREGIGRVHSGEQDLGTVGPDAYFGALTIQTGRPWNATVKAETPMRVFVLNAGEYEALVRGAPSVARRLSRSTRRESLRSSVSFELARA